MPPKAVTKDTSHARPTPEAAARIEGSKFYSYLQSESMTANLAQTTDIKDLQSYYETLFLDSGAILKFWRVPPAVSTDDEEAKLMKKLDNHDVLDLEVLIRLANRQIDVATAVTQLRADDQLGRQAEDPAQGDHIKIIKNFQNKADEGKHWMAMLQKIQKAKHFK